MVSFTSSVKKATLFFAFVLSVIWVNAQNASATWGANSNTAWYTTGNWAGGAYAGAQGATAVSNNYVATFTSAYTGTAPGINMATAQLNLGAISIDNTRTTATTISSSSGTGSLRLFGATLNSVANTIIRNNGTGLLTIQSGSGLNLALGTTTNNINTDGSGGVTISAVIGQVNTGSSITLGGSGTGVITLSGVNTFTGGVTIGSGTTLSIGNASALGTVAGNFTINGGNIDASSAITTVNYPQSWNGDFSFLGSNTLNLGTGAVTLNANRKLSVQSSTLTVGGSLGGAAYTFTKDGGGILLLTAASHNLGGLNVKAGELRLNPSANLSATSTPVTMNGGTLSTSGIALNRTIDFSTLNLTDHSTISLSSGGNAHSLKFTASTGATWTAGKMLTITNWAGTYSTGLASASSGRIYVGTTSGGLTVAQLSQIQFFDGSSYYPATLNSSGELVPGAAGAAPLNGTYTIGGSTGSLYPAGTRFSSIAAAVAALNINGILSSGSGVTFNVDATYTAETAPAGGFIISYSAVNTTNSTGAITRPVKFVCSTPGACTITASAANTGGAINDGIFKLIGAQYVTIDGFVLQENAANTITTLALNNMTEFGVGIFAYSTTIGAQNNTIQNCTISLGATYQNAMGVFSTSRNTVLNSILSPTATVGTNSGNKFYSNTISNVAFGMFFLAPAATSSVAETGVDIGGSSAATKNTITFGNAVAVTTSGWWSNFPASTVNAGVYFHQGVGSSVKYNSITSLSLAYANGVAGIYTTPTGTAPASGTFTSDFSNNNPITLTNTGTTSISGIEFGNGLAGGLTFAASSNTITINQNASALVSAALMGINAGYTSAGGTLSNNSVTINQTFSPSSSTSNTSPITGISLPFGTTGSPVVTAHGNAVTIARNSSIGAGVTATMGSSNVIGIKASNGITSTVNIGTSGNGNTIIITEGVSVAGTTTYASNAVYFIDAYFASTGHATLNIQYNNLNTSTGTLRSTGNTYIINPDATYTTALNVSNNSINIDRVAASGPLYGIYSNGSSAITSNYTMNSNTVTLNASTSGSVAGIYNNDGGTPVKTINSNTIAITGASATSYGIYANWGTSNVGASGQPNTISVSSSATSPTMYGIYGGGSATAVNAVANIIGPLSATATGSSAAGISGISINGGTNCTVSGNTISSLTTGNSTGSATVNGVELAGGTSTAVAANKIHTLTANTSGSSTQVYGIKYTSGTTAVNISNNLIGGLTAPVVSSTSDVIRGISFQNTTSSFTANVYYNTIYLNASSTGANFSTTGVYNIASGTATSTNLNLRNNIIVNTSTPSGTGITACLRRSVSATYANWATTSNNNLYYAGTLGANRTILLDNTTVYPTSASGYVFGPSSTTGSFLQAVGATRDAASISENPTWVSTTGSNAGFLHINTTTPTAIDNGAVAISGYTTDFDGDTRNASTPDIGADEVTLVLAGCVVPSGLTASALTYTSATVSWTAPSSGSTPVGYNWEVRTSGAGGSGSTGLTASGTTTAPTVSAATGNILSIGTTYNLYVQTDCGSGSTSTWAGPYSFSPLSCSVPTGLTSGSITSNSANISWTAPATGSPVGYEWEVRSSGAGGSGSTGLAASGSTTAPTVSAATGATLQPSTTYTLYVRTKCTNTPDYSTWAASSTFATLVQPMAYDFAASTGTYTAITSGGGAISTGFGTTFDDATPFTLTLSPAINFNGTTYTTMYITSNGFATLGSVAPANNEYDPISSTATYSVAIAPWGEDLNYSSVSGSAPSVLYQYQSGTNEWVVQWQDVGRYVSGGSTDRISFQARINATTGVVRFVYGGPITVGASATTLQVGLRGAYSVSNYPSQVVNRTTDITTATAITLPWDKTTYGTSSGSSMLFTGTTSPAANTVYTFTPITCQPFPTPAAATPVNANDATAKWTANGSANGYLVRWKKVTDALSVTSWATPTAVAGSSSNSYSMTGLSPSTPYIFEVAASCGAGNNSTFGPAISFTTANAACVAPVAQASALAFSNVLNTSLTGTITPNTPAADGYLVIRTAFGATAPTQPANATTYSSGNISTLGAGLTFVQTGSGVTFNQTGLTANTNYTYYVFAYNNTSCTGGPAYSTATVLSNSQKTCTAAPTSLAAGSLTTNSAIITWVDPTGAASYNLQYRVNGTSTWTTVLPTFGSGATYTITGLSPSTIYDVQVAAPNNACGVYAQTLSLFTTPCSAPTYAAFPYVQNFESWTNACSTTDIPTANWTNTPSTGNNSWRRSDQGASASWTSAGSGVYSPTSTVGTYSARFHSWNTSSSGTLDLFIDCSTGPATKELSFEYVNTGGTDILQVFVSTNGGSTFTQLGSDLVSVLGSAWIRQYFNFTSTSGTTVIRLKATGDNGSTDIGIDDLKVDAACTPVYASYPYSEGFESWTGCTGTSNVPSANWSSGPLPSSGSNCWRRNDQGATAQWSSTSGAYSPTSTVGTYSARFHSWSTTSSGNIDLYIDCSTGPAAKQVSFDYFNPDGGDILQVFVSTNGGSTFAQVGSNVGLVSSSLWTRQFFNFTSSSSTTIIRLKATGDNGSSDIGVDDLKVDAPCAPVYATLPFAGESFESWGNCSGTSNVPSTNWTSTPLPSYGNNVWRRNDQGAVAVWSSPTSGVYSPTSNVGTYSARFHSWNTTSSGSLDFYIDLSSSVSSKQISFDYINTSGGDILAVLVSTNGAAGPFVQVGSNLTTQATWANKTFTTTSTSATTVIRLTATGDNGSTDIGVDNFNVIVLAPMAISSITPTQVTGNLAVNTTNNDILTLNVATTGSTGGLALSTLKVTSANTSDADFGTVKLWGGPTATVSAHGSSVLATGTFSGGVVNFTGLTQALTTGNNYFWITYDVVSGATAGNVGDAKILAGDMAFAFTGPSVATGTQPASLLNPSGNRPILAALCGTTYTINNTLPTAGLNYQSFTEAVNDLNTFGLSCAVVFNVKDGQTFNEKVPAITTTGTSTNTITFQRDNSGASRPTLVGTTGIGAADAVIQLNGVDYLRWDGINIADNAANATSTTRFEYGAFLNGLAGNGCKNNIFKNSNISLTTANTSTRAVYTFSAGSTGGDNSNNQFLNLQLSNSVWGYNFEGTNAVYDDNNEINTVAGGTSSVTGMGSASNSATYGVAISYQTNFKLKNTTLSTYTSASNGDIFLVNSTAGSLNTMEVSGCTISGVTLTGSTSARVRGVSITSGATITVSKNIIRSLSSDGYVHGIYCGAGALIADSNVIGGSGTPITSTNGPTTVSGINCLVATVSAQRITNNNISYIVASGGLASEMYGIVVSSPNSVISGNTIQNLSSNGSATNRGIYVGSGSTAGTTVSGNTLSGMSSSSGDLKAVDIDGAGTTCSNNNISAISVTGTAAVWAVFTAAPNSVITGNTIAAISSTAGNASGIVASATGSGGSNVIIRSNSISDLLTGATASGKLAGAIGVFSTGTNLVEKNTIDNIVNNSVVGAIALGIRASGSSTSTNIINNMISNVTANASNNGGACAVRGITLENGATVKMYHNTVYLTGTATNASFESGALYTTTSATLDSRNNILVNNYGGTGTKAAIYFTSSATTYNSNLNAASNNNLLYAGTPSATNVILVLNTGGNKQALSDYTGILTSPKENASFTLSTLPFVSTAVPANLHIDLASATLCALNNKGVQITTTPTVPDDIDAANVRTTSTPDVGADEWTMPTPTPGTATASANPVCTGPITIGLTGQSTGSEFTYQWQRDNGSGTFVNIDATVNTADGNVYSNFTTATLSISSVTGKNNYKFRAVVSRCTPSAASATSNEITLTINCTTTWQGDVSGSATDWFNAGNWSSNAVPNSCADNVIIPTTPSGGLNFPVINSASAQVGNITLQSGATITVNSSRTLSVCGDFTGSTTSTASTVTGAGKVVLTGNAAQAVSGRTTFSTLHVAKNTGTTATIQANSNIDVTTALELESGTLANSGNLTLKSTATEHAIFNDFGAPVGTYTGSYSGSINEERYYRATSLNSYNQHYMGSPVSNATLAQFGAGSSSGAVTPTADCSEVQLDQTSVYGSVFTYNEANGSTCPMASWTVKAGTAAAQPAYGYSVAKTGSGTLLVSGTPNTAGTYDVTGLTNSNWTKGTKEHSSSTAFGSGWTLVANPYNATLDLTSITPPAGFDNQIQVWDVIQGQYYPLAGTKLIAPFQAFFVHRTTVGGTSTYTINGNWRVATATTFYALNTPEELTVTATNTANNLYDIATVGFNQNATDQFDPQYDANKLTGSIGRHNLSTQNNGYELNTNILSSIQNTSTVNMTFEPGATGNYTLTFGGLNSFDPTSYIMLEDKKLNTMYDVRNGDYSFTADAADDWNRFVLHFTPKAEVTTTDQQCETPGAINITQPGAANWNYTITDNTNNVISTGTLNSNSPISAAAATGTYTLTLTDNNNYQVVKMITVTGTTPVTAAFTQSVNSTTTNTDVAFNSSTQGVSDYYWDFGDGTTATGQNVIHSYSDTGSYTVTLIVIGANGCSNNTTQTITVSELQTGIGNVNGSRGIKIWSNGNRVFVDFSQLTKTDAAIEISNILGQQLVNERFGRNSIYNTTLSNLEATYVIVKVKQGEEITTKKVLITNTK